MPFVQHVTPSQLHSVPGASSSASVQRPPALPPDRVQPHDPRPALFTAAAIAAVQLVPGVAEGEVLGGAGIALGAVVRIGGKAVAEHIVPIAAAGARKALQLIAGMATTYAGDRVAQELLDDEAVPASLRAAAHAADEAFKSLLHDRLHR
ncbi:MAG: hypothetical protein NVS3B28_28990 [Candidatus Velthaea sp.]